MYVTTWYETPLIGARCDPQAEVVVYIVFRMVRFGPDTSLVVGVISGVILVDVGWSRRQDSLRKQQNQLMYMYAQMQHKQRQS